MSDECDVDLATITLGEMFGSFQNYMDVLHIDILNKCDVDLSN